MQSMSRAIQPEIADAFASAVDGDETAFARIVVAFDDEMYRVCVAVCRDQTIAADAVQAAWTIAWKKLGSVRQPDRLRQWLVSVAVNEGKKLLKSRTRRMEAPLPFQPAGPNDGRDPAASVDFIDLIAALERLNPDDRALLAMRYMAGFNSTELAAALGISAAGVRQRIKRLVDRLREELA